MGLKQLGDPFQVHTQPAGTPDTNMDVLCVITETKLQSYETQFI